MSFDSEAAQLRAGADPAALAAVVSLFPPADSLPPRTNWLHLTEYVLRKLPKDLEKREAYLIQKLDGALREETQTVARHDRIRSLGLAEITDYDICISSGGNPVQALRTALYLTANHVTYAKSFVMRFTLLLDEVRSDIEMSRPPQLDLFA